MLSDDSQLQVFLNLFKLGTELNYKKNEYIIRPGESPNFVYYIDEGLVKAFNISKYGEENLLIFRKPNEIFPLIWAVTGKGRSIIYQALKPTKVYRLTRETFIQHLKDKPDSMYPFIDLVINQYRIQSERVLNLEYRSVRTRLASFILTMSLRFGKTIDNGILVDVPLIQQDIASSINASRETTSRELGILERRKLIQLSQSTITILSKDGLKKLL